MTAAMRELDIKVLEGRDDAESFAFAEQGKADAYAYAYAMDNVLLYSLRLTTANS